MPSFRPAKDKPTNDTNVVATPAISSPLGRSPSTSSAPINVHTGPVARIGDAIDSGRCFTAKYEHIHDAATMVDLINNSPCCAQLNGSTCMIAGNASGRMLHTAIKISHTLALHTLAKNKTGSTAFSRTACLVESS
jgi:hypothetical protein